MTINEDEYDPTAPIDRMPNPQIGGRYQYWILEADHSVRPAKSLGEWARMFEDRDCRRVAASTIENGVLKLRVSTVFLGLDHNFNAYGPPILFETMVFDWSGGGHSRWEEVEMERCATYAGALIQHSDVCDRVKALLGMISSRTNG